MKRAALIVAFALVAAPAMARDPVPPFLGGIVQPRDVDLVFDYLRDAVRAAVQGREPAPSPEISNRAGEIAQDLKQRGAAAANAMLDAIEDSVRESVPRREAPLPPGRIRI